MTKTYATRLGCCHGSILLYFQVDAKSTHKQSKSAPTLSRSVNKHFIEGQDIFKTQILYRL